MKAEHDGRAATASEIREIVGGVDDAVLASIVAVGATQEEVLEAKTWLASDDYLHRELHHPVQGRAAQIVDILEAEFPDPDAP